VGVLAGDQELGVFALGVQGVGGDHRPGQVQGLQQRSEPGDLVGLAVHAGLGEHSADLLVGYRQQVHGLPAGWEIENAKLGGDDVKSLAWLGELTATRAVAARDDRYVAALDLTSDAPKFRLAYLVRAVTPGEYALPGAGVEDMYKPRFFARQAVGRITVHPAP